MKKKKNSIKNIPTLPIPFPLSVPHSSRPHSWVMAAAPLTSHDAPLSSTPTKCGQGPKAAISHGGLISPISSMEVSSPQFCHGQGAAGERGHGGHSSERFASDLPQRLPTPRPSALLHPLPASRRPARHRRRQRYDGVEHHDGVRGVEPSQQVSGIVTLKLGMKLLFHRRNPIRSRRTT